MDIVREVVKGESLEESVVKLGESGKVEKSSENGMTATHKVDESHKGNGDEAQAKVAAEVADSAQKLDG